jgi:hypothetical protein
MLKYKNKRPILWVNERTLEISGAHAALSLTIGENDIRTMEEMNVQEPKRIYTG